MGKFKFTQTGIKDMFIVEPSVFEDNRGYFMETYNEGDFKQAGHDLKFVQQNQSRSSKGVLRGLHLQVNHPQGKLVQVIKGEVFDVGVDLRGDSKLMENGLELYYLKIIKTNLYSSKICSWVLVLSDEAIFSYNCTEFYHGEDESGIIWNDEDIAINWPLDDIDEIILSEKDKRWKTLKESQIKY